MCIDGTVYVVGGIGRATDHARVERYDPVANEWRTLPSMGTGRSLFGGVFACAAVACDL